MKLGSVKGHSEIIWSFSFLSISTLSLTRAAFLLSTCFLILFSPFCFLCCLPIVFVPLRVYFGILNEINCSSESPEHGDISRLDGDNIKLASLAFCVRFTLCFGWSLPIIDLEEAFWKEIIFLLPPPILAKKLCYQSCLSVCMQNNFNKRSWNDLDAHLDRTSKFFLISHNEK